jgi:hypothetical protein
MKICWDNLENIKLLKNGNFRDVKRGIIYSYKEKCGNCREPFLSHTNCKGKYCCHLCGATSIETRKS